MASKRMGGQRNISRTKALSRLKTAAKSPQVDRSRAAKNVAPAQAKTPADFRLQKRWFAAPTQMDFEGVDTPTSPPIPKPGEVAPQEEVSAPIVVTEPVPQPGKKADDDVIMSVKMVGQNAYLNNEPINAEQAPYLKQFIEEEGFTGAEKDKVLKAFEDGWIHEQKAFKEKNKDKKMLSPQLEQLASDLGAKAVTELKKGDASIDDGLNNVLKNAGIQDPVEVEKAYQAYERGFDHAQAQKQAMFKESIHNILKEQFGYPNVAKDASTETLMLLLANEMGKLAGEAGEGPNPNPTGPFMLMLAQANLPSPSPVLKAYTESWEEGALTAPDGAEFKNVIEDATPADPPEPFVPPAPHAATLIIKASPSPLDASGKPLVKGFNLKHMEQLAQAGDSAELINFALALEDKMLSKAKKAAVKNAAQELLGQIAGQETMEQASESGLSDLIEDVQDGSQKLPKQSFPSTATVIKEETKFAENRKSYDKDLEQVSGKKGSNEGGLFKDKNLQTLHYVKWSSDNRAKIEALANRLYTVANVPVPNARIIKFKGKTAIMSDWIDDVKPMSFAEMSKHPDVRRNFVVDAWLANWDAVGMNADNIVSADGTAYRIDPGGSLIFRAQGMPKKLDGDSVPELETMRQSASAPQASQVFKNLTAADLKAGAKAVSLITDQQIDDAVDAMDFPVGPLEDYPATVVGPTGNNLGLMLKEKLKARRDIIIKDVLNAKPPKKLTAKELAKRLEDEKLSDTTLKIIATDGPKFTPNATPKLRLDRQRKVLNAEQGDILGPKSNGIIDRSYRRWKGQTTTTEGAFLRWAIAKSISDAEGERELDKMREFWTIQKHGAGHGLPKSQWEQPSAEFQELQQQHTDDLVNGLKVTRAVNRGVLTVQTEGNTTVTIYRTWVPDQVSVMGWDKASIGDIIEVKSPSAFSWSFSPSVFSNPGHGGIRVKAQVPLNSLHLTDRVNNTFGVYPHEDEVVFKGKEVKMEVIKKS